MSVKCGIAKSRQQRSRFAQHKVVATAVAFGDRKFPRFRGVGFCGLQARARSVELCSWRIVPRIQWGELWRSPKRLNYPFYISAIVQGTPEALAQVPHSYTGQYPLQAEVQNGMVD